MANVNFTCDLEAWRDGRTLHARMHYYRTDGLTYFYQDTSFPTPTMNLGGTVYEDTAFANAIHSGVNIGSVYTTEFSREVAGSGERTVTFTAGSGGRSDFAGSWSKTVTFPAADVPPSGLELSNIVATPNTVSATCALSSWGSPDGSSNSYRELNVSVGGSHDVRRFQKVYGSSKTGTITVTNSSEQLGGMNIVPNTEYFIWMFATNGSASTLTPERGENIVTPVLPMKTAEVVPGTDNAHISYTLEADGGVYMKRIQCRLDGGLWSTRDVIADYDETSSDFYITDLVPGTEHTVELQIMTEAGVTPCGTYTFTTLSSVNFYLPVKAPGSDKFTTKKMQKMYVGVRQPDMSLVTTKVKKLYGRGADGKTKLVFSGE